MSGNSFNISSKDVLVTYTNTLLTLPILMNGSGTDNIISFDAAEVADMRPTADGNYASYVKNAVASGKLTFTGTSPSILQLLNVMQQQFTLGGAVVGAINVTNPATGAAYRINTITLTSAPPAPSFGTEIKDFEVSFKCQPFANIASLGAIIDTARNVVSLL
jgi:hypothetical protein